MVLEKEVIKTPVGESCLSNFFMPAMLLLNCCIWFKKNIDLFLPDSHFVQKRFHYDKN